MGPVARLGIGATARRVCRTESIGELIAYLLYSRNNAVIR
jgi:hypothetical protein